LILKRYILIFTLALISCAGTNYIHSLSEQDKTDQINQEVENQKVTDNFIIAGRD